MSWTQERSTIAHLHRQIKRGERSADDPELAAAYSRFAAEKISDYVKKVLADAPPLSDEQRTKLAELLKPARNGGAAHE